MKALHNIGISVILLFIIMGLGIFFDIIGTAATATDKSSYNAKAAKKIYGAGQAVRVASNADAVANYCNDVIGDISGTLSGAIGASIVLHLGQQFTLLDTVLTGAVMTSLIASVTVGGKAIGKNIAINNANDIIFRVAVILAWWEDLTGMELFKNRR
jgi:CBS domain containing-hemolysin-like protein